MVCCKILNASAGITWNCCHFLGRENKLVKERPRVFEREKSQHLWTNKKHFLDILRCFRACLDERLYLEVMFCDFGVSPDRYIVMLGLLFVPSFSLPSRHGLLNFLSLSRGCSGFFVHSLKILGFLQASLVAHEWTSASSVNTSSCWNGSSFLKSVAHCSNEMCWRNVAGIICLKGHGRKHMPVIPLPVDLPTVIPLWHPEIFGWNDHIFGSEVHYPSGWLWDR